MLDHREAGREGDGREGGVVGEGQPPNADEAVGEFYVVEVVAPGVGCVGIVETDSRLCGGTRAHQRKALGPMRSKLAGRRMSLRFRHPENVPLLRTLRPAGRSMDRMPLSAKAYFPTEQSFQSSGSVIELSLPQLMKL